MVKQPTFDKLLDSSHADIQTNSIKNFVFVCIFSLDKEQQHSFLYDTA